MAKVTFLSPLNLFSDADNWKGSISNTSPTSFVLGDGVHEFRFSGNFAWSTGNQATGTISASSYFENNVEVLRIENASGSASWVSGMAGASWIIQGILAGLLGSADTIVGSSGADGIIGFGGNDTIYAGPGNDAITGAEGDDYIDGGDGIDTVYFYGDIPPVVTRTARGFSVKSIAMDGIDTLVNVERIYGATGGMIALDVGADGTAGKAYRLYKAAFDRTPDSAGVGYWIGAMDKGMSLQSVAQNFINSQEYKDAYGTGLGSHDIVTKYYENILHRMPEQAGLDFWAGALDKGASLASVLAAISESPENIDATAVVIGNGFAYTPWG